MGYRSICGGGVIARCISLLNAVRKIYAGILVDGVRRVIQDLIDDDQEGFR